MERGSAPGARDHARATALEPQSDTGPHTVVHTALMMIVTAQPRSGLEFTTGDFGAARLKPSDFIYADPPYDVEFTQSAIHVASFMSLLRPGVRMCIAFARSSVKCSSSPP